MRPSTLYSPLSEPGPSSRRDLPVRDHPPAFAFTLIELLVVISIIALLISILLPALSKGRGEARKVMCSSNMRQLGLAFQGYIVDNRGHYPAGREWGSGSTHRIIGWDDLLAPYDGRGPLTRDVAEIPFLNPNNYSGAGSGVYLCPGSRYQDTGPGFRISYVAHSSSYKDVGTGKYRDSKWLRGVLHPQTPTRGGYSMKTSQIFSPSSSIAMFEWHVFFHDMGQGPIGYLHRLRNAHANTLHTAWFPTLNHQWVHGRLYAMNFLFADGSVRFMDLADTVNAATPWYLTSEEQGNGLWDCRGK